MIMESRSLTFLEWLNLNVDSITWEGRNKEQFYALWEVVICSENSFASLENVISMLSPSPLKRWFSWLQEMNIVYFFFIKDYSLEQLVDRSQKSFNEINIILRDYFLKIFPLEIELADKVFSSGNKLYRDDKLCFEKSVFSSYKELAQPYLFSDVMKEVEITLMEGWRDVVESSKESLGSSKPKISISPYSINPRFLREVILLTIIGIFIIFATRVGNKFYEDKILSQVSLLKTDFSWLDNQISYKKENSAADTILLDSKELEDLEKTESQIDQAVQVSASTFEGESDVVLTSINSLPKDFGSASLEQSKYEEIKEGGYRDHRYGRGRAYRILINSFDVKDAKVKIKNFMEKYNLEQVDNVAPGTVIPGGIYYNLYASSDILKDFMSELDQNLEITVYESRTAFSAPKNMNKIFIWVKLI